MGRVIEIPYKPRPLQKTIHNSLKRFNVIVCHRRFGKTVFAINDLIKTIFTTKHKNPRCAYIAPLHRQAKQIAWDYAKEYTRPIPWIKVNESELRIDFPNGGRLQLFGADNPDSLRGIYLDGVCLDEYAQMSPRVWSEVIRPALADRKGKAIFIGTPQGMNNFYQQYAYAESDPDWFNAIYKASQTNILDQSELDAMKREMTPEEYDQEVECSWQAAIRGAYYGKEMQAAETRITKVMHDPMLPVVTSWDLGMSDSTVVLFWQINGTEIRMIDMLEFQNTGLPEIVKALKEKPYNIQKNILPHDVKVRELGTGKSRQEVLEGLGVKVELAPNQSLMDGINATRSLIPRMWFDKKKCHQAIEALKQYRTDYDDQKQVFRSSPRHDWTSHYADAARYFAISDHTIRQRQNRQKPYRKSGWMG